MRHRHVDLDAAGPAHRAGMEECDDAVARVEELLGLMSELCPLLGERSQVMPDAGVTPNRSASKRGQVRMPLDLRVTLPNHGLYVSAVASAVQPPSGFHVLLRHRPPSIPPKGEARRLRRLSGTVNVKVARRGLIVPRFCPALSVFPANRPQESELHLAHGLLDLADDDVAELLALVRLEALHRGNEAGHDERHQ